MELKNYAGTYKSCNLKSYGYSDYYLDTLWYLYKDSTNKQITIFEYQGKPYAKLKNDDGKWNLVCISKIYKEAFLSMIGERGPYTKELTGYILPDTHGVNKYWVTINDYMKIVKLHSDYPTLRFNGNYSVDLTTSRRCMLLKVDEKIYDEMVRLKKTKFMDKFIDYYGDKSVNPERYVLPDIHNVRKYWISVGHYTILVQIHPEYPVLRFNKNWVVNDLGHNVSLLKVNEEIFFEYLRLLRDGTIKNFYSKQLDKFYHNNDRF